MPFDLPVPNDPPGDAEPEAAPALRVATTPPYRRLRVFAFDPLLSNQLDTAGINQITLPVLWEEGLRPGPIGEYVEVVDYDESTDRKNESIDLNHPHLLATDGLAPSDGNLKFHQQMVYAVAMITIRHFEQALGRRALWASRSSKNSPRKDEFVRRLRIYPHSFKGANAYYSPDKMALLFGYFPASTATPGRNLPGGTVFTCLSHDVIAHEMTHALLDGMHNRFIEPSNPDVLAFHEAFADTVAIFQHFTFPEVLKHQIAKTRGNLADQNLLGELAQQFGEALGIGGALRNSLKSNAAKSKEKESVEADSVPIQNTFEPHARGSILVAAVFDAFLSIYKRRSADLLRIATGGSGILPAGELHPDLVNRLATLASKTARQILIMCIRALDYCPPVDITFGEYLRALITADTELIHDDDLGYRIAVTEAFRKHSIYPFSVRSLAPDSLVWEPVDDQPAGEILGRLLDSNSKPMLERLNQWNLTVPRKQAFENARELRKFLHFGLCKLRDADKKRQIDDFTGLALSSVAPWSILRSKEDGLPRFEIHAVRPARRVGPDGQLTQSLIVEITQKRYVFNDPLQQAKADRGGLSDSALKRADFIFRGGCTLIFDLEIARLRYCIRKNIQGDERIERQRQFLNRQGSSGMTEFLQGASESSEPFAFLHRDRF